MTHVSHVPPELEKGTSSHTLLAIFALETGQACACMNTCERDTVMFPPKAQTHKDETAHTRTQTYTQNSVPKIAKISGPHTMHALAL